MSGGLIAFTQRSHGDFDIDGEPVALADRRRAVDAGAWTWLRQVHGADVIVVTTPGEHAGVEADAAVTAHRDAVLAVHTADCAPVLFTARDHPVVVGAAHVGWRGLVAGVLEATVDQLVTVGAGRLEAHVGPHIRARCYEFGAGDLDTVAARYGDGVRGTTAWGAPALDLLAGIRAALAGRPEIDGVAVEPGCTACEPDRFYSHRARGESGRHAAVVRPGPR